MEWRDFIAGVALPPYIKVCPHIFLHIWIINTSTESELIVQISVFNQLWISLNRTLRAGGTSLFQLCFHQVQLDATSVILGLDVLSSQEKKIWNVVGTTLQPWFGTKLQVETCWLVRKAVDLHWESEIFICRAFGSSFLVPWFPIVPFWNSAYFLFFLTIRIVVTPLFNLKDKYLTLGSSAVCKHL